MPVPVHWTAWQGGPEVLVASQIGEGETPIAYDVAGNRVTGIPATTPPATPTLVVVPVETDFSPALARQTCQDGDCGGGGGTSAGGGSPPAGNVLQLAGINITDDHEPWTAGDLEFEIWVFAANTDGTPRLHDELVLSPYSHYGSRLDADGCVSDQVASGLANYWDYNNTGVFVTYSSPQPVFFTVSDAALWSTYRWDVLVIACAADWGGARVTVRTLRLSKQSGGSRTTTRFTGFAGLRTTRTAGSSLLKRLATLQVIASLPDRLRLLWVDAALRHDTSCSELGGVRSAVSAKHEVWPEDPVLHALAANLRPGVGLDPSSLRDH